MAETKEKKFMDIAKKPEEATADIGSKPMIVGHKMATDPMVRESEESSKPEVTTAEPEKLVPPSQKQKPLAPIVSPSENKETTANKVASETENKDSHPLDQSKETPASEKTEAKTEIDPVAAEMEKQDELNKIIDSKKYFVSVKQARGSNSLAMVIALVVLLLAGLMTLFYFVDTDKLDVGFELPFSLFSKKEQAATETTPTPAAATSPTEKVTDQVVPEKPSETVSYANATFGVSFDYPKTWGEVKLEQINGYADQSYGKEIPYFLEVTFSTLKDVEVRVINGRAFEGGRDFMSSFGQAEALISFMHKYAFAYEKTGADSYELVRISSENVAKDMNSDTLTSALYTFTAAEDTLRIEPKWTLENLNLLPWDSGANESLSQADAETQLAAKNKLVMLVRNYSSEKALGVNATYNWSTGEKDTVVETALVELVNSIK